ncbi:MAG: hypothetical protein M0C28_27675 [Candidatus Moduliflexus flocculans]|nr:hypothetical protein [Candidatus Moduliflexus flocculans]
MMRIGLFKTSLKENERRLPVHPEHLPRFPKDLRRQMVFESGYGSDFGYPDDLFEDLCGGVIPRDSLFTDCDVLALPKPLPAGSRQDEARARSSSVGRTPCSRGRSRSSRSISGSR